MRSLMVAVKILPSAEIFLAVGAAVRDSHPEPAHSEGRKDSHSAKPSGFRPAR